MSLKPTLPEPSLDYNADRERVRNAAILRLIGSKTDKDKLPQYPGIPMLIMNGSTTSFNVPTGAGWTTLPFDSASLFNGFLGSFDTGASLATLSAAMTVQSAINIAHVAGGAAVDVLVDIGVFINGALFKQLTQSIPFNKDCNIFITDYLANLAQGDTIQLKIKHDNAGTFVVNMIQSNWTITQLSPNPANVESRL